MVAAHLRRRAAAAALALFCAGFLSTCDFLTSDIFPTWFSYVEARVDLRSILATQGLGDQAEVVTVEYAPYDDGSNDYSKVLVFAAGNLARRLVALDPGTLAFRSAQPGINLNASIAAGAADFRCGDVLITPSDLSPYAPPAVWNNPGTRMFRTAVGGMNYVVRPNSSSQAVFEECDPGWAVGPSVTRNFDTPNNFYNFQDAEFVNGWSVLAIRQDNYFGYAACFAMAADFYAGGTVFDNAGAVKTGPFRADEGWAWLTAGGPVAFVRGDRNTDRLVRYRWGTGDFASGTQAEMVDDIPFDSNDEIRILSFDRSGQWWFAYDRKTGYLYKLRTWWK